MRPYIEDYLRLRFTRLHSVIRNAYWTKKIDRCASRTSVEKNRAWTEPVLHIWVRLQKKALHMRSVYDNLANDEKLPEIC